jgi:hypothetical protein
MQVACVACGYAVVGGSIVLKRDECPNDKHCRHSPGSWFGMKC